MANPMTAKKLMRVAGKWLLGTNIKYKDATKHRLQMTANLDKKAIKRLINGIYFQHFYFGKIVKIELPSFFQSPI